MCAVVALSWSAFAAAARNAPADGLSLFFLFFLLRGLVASTAEFVEFMEDEGRAKYLGIEN